MLAWRLINEYMSTGRASERVHVLVLAIRVISAWPLGDAWHYATEHERALWNIWNMKGLCF